jgi:hypothetical protein
VSARLGIELVTPGRSGAELAARLPQTSSNVAQLVFRWLMTLLDEFGRGARLRLQIDESSPVAATGTVTLTQASLTAGDRVMIGTVNFVAVSGAADATLGQWSRDTSDTAAATSLALAINTFWQAKGLVTATSSTGVVTITAAKPGVASNLIQLAEQDASGGIARSGNYLTGGRDESSLPSCTGTFSNVGTNGETLVIGGVTLTLVAAAANENQVTIGGSADATRNNVVAAINVHTRLRGIFLATATATTGQFTLQYLRGGRDGYHVFCTETSAVFAWAPTSAQFSHSLCESCFAEHYPEP